MNILIIAGRAGVGKDTAADLLVESYGGTKIALADPLKEFAEGVFDFAHGQLWGPSAERNKPDPRYGDPLSVHWGMALRAVEEDLGAIWLEHVCPGGVDLLEARRALIAWVHDLHDRAGREGALTPRTVLQTLGCEWGRVTLGEDVWVLHALALATASHFAVITDGRFPNEVALAREAGARALLLHSPDQSDTERAKAAGIPGHASEAHDFSWHEVDALVLNDKPRGREFLRDVLLRHMPIMFPNLPRRT